MEYVVIDLHVDIFRVNQGTIEIENAGTDWRKGDPGSSNVHCLRFIYKRVRAGLLVDSSNVLQLLRQSFFGYCRVEAQPRTRMLLLSGTQHQCRNGKVISGSAYFIFCLARDHTSSFAALYFHYSPSHSSPVQNCWCLPLSVPRVHIFLVSRFFPNQLFRLCLGSPTQNILFHISMSS